MKSIPSAKRPAKKAAKKPVAKAKPKAKLVTKAGQIDGRHGLRKLSDAKVRKIRSLIKKQWTLTAIAKKFEVSHATISRIHNGHAYAEVV